MFVAARLAQKAMRSSEGHAKDNYGHTVAELSPAPLGKWLVQVFMGVDPSKLEADFVHPQ